MLNGQTESVFTSTLLKFLVIGLGGFIGAIARYALSGLAHRSFGDSFPHGTFVVNIVGCFVIGSFIALVEDRQVFGPHVRLFVLVGVLGSLTTFSTFGHETVELLRSNQSVLALLNIAINVFLGLGAVLLGRAVVKLFV